MIWEELLIRTQESCKLTGSFCLQRRGMSAKMRQRQPSRACPPRCLGLLLEVVQSHRAKTKQQRVVGQLQDQRALGYI